jgi:heme-degrading monooxygenase HmoA
MTTPIPEAAVAVIFTATRSTGNADDDADYDTTVERMQQLAAQQDGYVSLESVYDSTTDNEITVSYWRDEQAARAWKTVAEHRHAQQQGRARWYSSYQVVVAQVVRAYGYPGQR